jgi:hypothetical protein
VRTALEALIERRRRGEIGAAIVAGYRRRPQRDEEGGWNDDATRQMITEEHW